MKNMEQQFSEKKLIISRHGKQSSSSVREYSDSIPVDLLIDIFLRVPSKSIARFCCVSKLWGSILQRPDFIKLYLTRCPRILFTLTVNNELLFFSSPQHPNPEEKSCVVATRYNTSFPQYVPSKYKTMRCGLVFCMGSLGGRWGSKVKKVRVICNPTTGEFLTLPKVLLKDKAAALPNVRVTKEGFYFGYDPIGKQFKVLCMTSSNTHRVLTLENGKRKWRTVESEFDYRKSNLLLGEICIDGVLYFGCDLQRSYGIVCFDVGSEKLSFINIGKDMIKEGSHIHGHTNLINYKGKIGIHERGYDMWAKEKDIGFDLWVLEDAENHKWSKHVHVFPPLWKKIVSQNWLHITGTTSTGEMVFVTRNLSNPFYVFYYNFETKTFTRVNIRGFEEFVHSKNYKPIIHTFMDYWENMKLFK